MSVLRRRPRPPYKLLSLLLQYPSDELLAARTSLREEIEALPSSPEREALRRFFDSFGTRPGLELQQEYVETFDLRKQCGLYLSHYTEGDTRKRGMALLRLKRLYAASGLPLDGPELPDFLPVMLEFAALAPAGRGRRLLAEHRAGLELLRTALRACESPYLHLVDAVCADLPGLAAAELERVRRLAVEGPPLEEVGLQPFAPPEVMPGVEARR
jgi:nitrate reductase molybdenum cofactor assembly chaperone NarJ/NarW